MPRLFLASLHGQVMKRRIAPNPKALDWRDPDMPVLRYFERPWGEKALDEEPPEKEQAWRQEVMATGPAPKWVDDPSYNWARPGARRRRI